MNKADDKFQKLLDERGRVKRWPTKKAVKLLVLQYLQSKFEKGKKYSEKEFSSILKEWHLFNDHALLRREMYDNYLVDRTRDGREYRLRPAKGGTSFLKLGRF
jgi:hypothetical protein